MLHIGREYFLELNEKGGVYVKVLNPTTKENELGWNSSVHVQITGSVGVNKAFFETGSFMTVNATKLSERRAT
jgi:hypothetical protein